MKNVIVTGGAGFIGSHVCEALLKRGDKVICIDNFDDYYEPKIKENNISWCIKNPNFVMYRADIRDCKEIDNIFEKEQPLAIVHLAAKAGVRTSLEKPSLYEEVNVRGTLNLLESAKKFKVKDVVFASSSSVYGNSEKEKQSESDITDKQVSHYAATKKACELLCHTYHYLYGINCTCLRFFTVYGPRCRPDMATYKFMRAILEGEKIKMFGDGRSSRDYTHVKDITDGILSALDKGLPFEIINLGSGRKIELNMLLEVIENATGRKFRKEYVGEQAGDVKHTCADISKAKKLLGYCPKIEIAEGIKDFFEYFRKNHL